MSKPVAIVTGAGGELGRAVAVRLSAGGFTVAGIDRKESGLKELPDGIRREVADPVDPAGARSVVDRIAAAAGPPEVLVNTIGAYHVGEALTATPDDLRLMIDVNLGSALWLTQAVVPYQRERGTGTIVHVAETRSFAPPDQLAHSVTPEAIADIIVYLATDRSAPVSGAIVPAYGA